MLYSILDSLWSVATRSQLKLPDGSPGHLHESRGFRDANGKPEHSVLSKAKLYVSNIVDRIVENGMFDAGDARSEEDIIEVNDVYNTKYDERQRII